jgi:hypothetical protein
MLLGCAIGPWPPAPVAAGREAASLRLDVLLSVSSELSKTSRRALVTEAERIWQHEQIDLEWAAAAGGARPPDAPLRVLVIARPAAAISDGGVWPVAELIRHADHRALAIASIDGARRVVNEATRYRVLESPDVENHRLGLVLGRAVAHEIGHFLLATATHAEHGLMRATVAAREFGAISGDTFRLDENASRWIRQRVSSDGIPIPAMLAAFSYTQP